MDVSVGPAEPYFFSLSDSPPGKVPPGNISAVCEVGFFPKDVYEYN